MAGEAAKEETRIKTEEGMVKIDKGDGKFEVQPLTSVDHPVKHRTFHQIFTSMPNTLSSMP